MKIAELFSSTTFFKVINKFKFYFENIQFKIFSNLLKKYKVDFYYKDQLGILTKREYGDNFRYIFQTKNSCDAFPLMSALSNRIIGSDISIDVGANIGITTIWMAKNSKKVYAFEPEINNIKRLKDNLSLNNVVNTEVIEKAVSNQNDIANLNIFKSYGHHSLSTQHISPPVDTQRVEVVTLDKFCATRDIKKIDFLKIDVEGFELEVLDGAKELLKNKQIKLIAFEHSKILLEKQGRSLDSVINLLVDNGYGVFDLSNNEIKKSQVKDLVQQDLYAI